MLRNWHLYILLAAAIVLKGSLLLMSQVIANDGPRYINVAQILLEGDWRQAFSMPITWVTFPGLIAVMSFIVPDLELAGRIVSFLASIAVVIPCYALIAETFDENSAFFGTAALLSAPRINEFSVDIMRESVFILIFLLAMLYVVRYLRNGGNIDLLYAVLFSVVSVLIRLEGFLLLFIFISYLLYVIVRGHNILKIKTINMAVLSFAVAVLIVVIYNIDVNYVYKSLRIDQVYTRLFLSPDSGYSTYVDEIKHIIRGIKGAGINSQWENDFFQIVNNNVGIIYFIGLVEAIFNAMFPLYCLIAIYALAKNNCFKIEHRFLCLVAACYMLFSYLYLIRMNFMPYRYLFPIALLLYPWVGFGVKNILARWSDSRFRGAIIALCFGMLIVWPVYESYGHFENQMISGKEAGRWLAAEGLLQGGDRLVANDGTAPYYAGISWNSYFDLASYGLDLYRAEDWPKIEALALANNAKAIVLAANRRKMARQPELGNYVLTRSFEDSTYLQLIFVRASQ